MNYFNKDLNQHGQMKKFDTSLNFRDKIYNIKECPSDDNSPVDINLVRTTALNGDLEGSLTYLDRLKIPYVRTQDDKKVVVTFSYENKEYEYRLRFPAIQPKETVVLSRVEPQLIPLSDIPFPLRTERLPLEVESAGDNNEAPVAPNTIPTEENKDSTFSSDAKEDYPLDYWLNRPCGGTTFPAKTIEALFSSDEIAECFILNGNGYNINDISDKLNLRTSMYNMFLYEDRTALDNVQNNESEKNIYIHSDSYSAKELEKYNFTEQEIAEYFVKINDSYYVKRPLIIDGKETKLLKSTLWELLDALRDSICASGKQSFNNIFDYYYYHREKPDENADTVVHAGAVDNPEDYIYHSFEYDFALGSYSYYDNGVRAYIKSILGKDYTENIYEYLINKAYNSLNISDYYSNFDPELSQVDIHKDKLMRDMLSAIDTVVHDYKSAIERRKGDDFNDIWDYYSREELGIDPEKDGGAWIEGSQDPKFHISMQYRTWLQDADYVGYAASRWGMRDKINTDVFQNAYQQVWNNAFESLKLEEYYTKTQNGDYIILINKFKEDFINALDKQIACSKPQI